MTDKPVDMLDEAHLAMVLEDVPVGITVIDPDGHILYYNAHCTKFVDRKPEYIGRNIAFCHQKPESVVKINQMLDALKTGRKETIKYEAVRNGKTLAVTVSPFQRDGELIGFIQSFVEKK